MRFGSEVWRWCAAAVAWVSAELELRDVLFVSGLGLAGYGAWLVYAPAGYLLPGLLLLWFTRPVPESGVDTRAAAELVLQQLAKGR